MKIISLDHTTYTLLFVVDHSKCTNYWSNNVIGIHLLHFFPGNFLKKEQDFKPVTLSFCRFVFDYNPEMIQHELENKDKQGMNLRNY